MKATTLISMLKKPSYLSARCFLAPSVSATPIRLSIRAANRF